MNSVRSGLTFLRAVIQTARPQQWVKNLALFGAIFFNGRLFDPHLLSRTAIGFTAICLLSSSNYFLNDLVDLPSDRKHRFKQRRPLARGQLGVVTVYIFIFLFASTGLWISSTLGPWFFTIAVVFLFLHYTNTLALRNMRVIDIVTIAFFYVLRVYAGQAASGQNLSIWLTLTVLSLSLLLASGKRRAEYSYFHGNSRLPKNSSIQHGSVRYSESLLDAYTSMFAGATFIAYAYFTFQAAPMTVGLYVPTGAAFTYLLSARKWLMTSLPFVIYGIMRYLQILYSEPQGVLSEMLIKDRRLITSVALWGVTVFAVIYGFGG